MASQGSSAVSAASLAQALGDWPSRSDMLYEALARTLKELVERGDLPPGAALPAERELARALNVSRGTVVNALHLLRAERMLESRGGSGTRVRSAAPPALPQDSHLLAQEIASRSLAGRFFDAREDIVDMALSLLHDAEPLTAMEMPTWEALVRATGGHGYAPAGLHGLREAIRGYYADRGLRTQLEEVAVTAGAQQALDLIASISLRRGDAVLVESPTYPGALDIFLRHGARVVTMPFATHWDRPALLGELVARHSPRLIYLMPGLHNPTGRSLPEGRRREIARLADSGSAYVIEDATLADTLFVPRERPLIAAYANGPRVITVGSLSKSVWGGLRVGWVRGDRGFIDRLTRLRAAKDLGSSPLPQLLAIRALADLDSIIAQRRCVMSGRAQHLRGLLAQLLPEWRVSEAEGGLSFWVTLPVITGELFAQAALRQGVAVIAGSAHCADDAGARALRLSFSQPEDVLTEGVKRLTRAWADCGGVALRDRPLGSRTVSLHGPRSQTG